MNAKQHLDRAVDLADAADRTADADMAAVFATIGQLHVAIATAKSTLRLPIETALSNGAKITRYPANPAS